MNDNKKDIDILMNSDMDSLRIPARLIQIQKFFLENKISEEECKVLARMLNAYYNTKN